jgi:hypothetical protein
MTFEAATAKIDDFFALNVRTGERLAAEYAAETEQYIFVTDNVLDVLDLPRAERLVNYVEDRFDAINGESAQ